MKIIKSRDKIFSSKQNNFLYITKARKDNDKLEISICTNIS